jgi:hypothetical protein
VIGISLLKCLPRTYYWIENYMPKMKIPIIPPKFTDLDFLDPSSIDRLESVVQREKKRTKIPQKKPLS